MGGRARPVVARPWQRPGAVGMLDGSESKNTLNFQGNAIDQLSKVKWDGGTLKVDTSMSFDGNPVNVTMALSLDASGNLVVVSTRPDSGRAAAPRSRRRRRTRKRNRRGLDASERECFTRLPAVQLGSTLVCVSGAPQVLGPDV
jgi:hypothetical protein